MNTYRFTLRRSRAAMECDICAAEIPAPDPPDYPEYWRVDGGPASDAVPRVICCWCHALHGFPTDGWIRAADDAATYAPLHQPLTCN